MHTARTYPALVLAAFLAIVAGVAPSRAAVLVQCPGGPGPAVKCAHLTAGDGFITMADRKVLYTFGFSDVWGLDPMVDGVLAANFTAPTYALDQGDQFYLNLTNVGMLMRPDLFDAHTVHFHGFPNASNVFDGEPHGTMGINMGATLTYYYNIVEPGTYMYHCHIEATEHMQMGMLGNIYVRPAQDKTGCPLGACPSLSQPAGYAYNDGDGSTRYDVDFAIQMGGMDPYFHDQHIAVQPLPFYLLRDTYPMLNGRGYPDTVIDNVALLPPQTDTDGNPIKDGNFHSQPVSSLITARAGQKILLRLSNLNVTRDYTLATMGVPMKVVGYNARLLRGPDGKDLSYAANSITLGSGETAEAIVQVPADAIPGSTTYFLYTTNLNYLSNDQEDFGGMMTEIRVVN